MESERNSINKKGSGIKPAGIIELPGRIRGISHARTRGVALVLVLIFLVLIVALTLAFFSSVTTERSASKSYASGANVKLLADSATQAVMGAVEQGTPDDPTVAWASQPGMIRTYDSSGNAKAFYKLYSSGSMVVTGSGYSPSSDVSTSWSSQPALYTDLNAPVVSVDGTAHYPIISGNNLKTWNAPMFSGTTQAETYFSGTNTTPDVEGFWILTGGTNKVPTGGSVLLSGTTTGVNPVPMPVQWLYVLQDGSLAAATISGTGTQVTVTGASTSNPIVGRIAFWTDDDSCKLNVNTASEGAFWDTPRDQGVTDFALANYQPNQNEYQRYPGHPAMTCLSSVMGSIFPVDHTTEPSVSGYASSNPIKYPPYQPYYDMNPKLNDSAVGNNLGSQAGTVFSSGSTALTPKNDRLYTSVDEFLFAPYSAGPSTAPTFSGTVRTINPMPDTVSNNSSKLTPALMDESKFFLTADSRSPDVNLYNEPRIVTWPVNSNTTSAYRTIFDQAIAFCGTINTYPFYFQRNRNDHPTNDLPTTGGGVGLGRNRDLISYLQALTAQNEPGFGGNFSAKYPSSGTASISERDQILTETFDYIRCLNLIDMSSGSMIHPFAPIATTVSPNNYPTNYAAASTSGLPTTGAGNAQVVPIYDAVTKTKGFGRFPTISEVSILFIATGWNDGAGGKSTDVNYWTATNSDGTPSLFTSTFTTGTLSGTHSPWGFYSGSTNTALGLPTSAIAPPLTIPTSSGTAQPSIPDKNIQVQAILLINFFDPSQGEPGENGTYSVQASGLNAFTWGASSGSASMGFPGTSPANTSQMCSSQIAQYAVSWGGNLGFRKFMATYKPAQAPGTTSYYPFISNVQNFSYDPTQPTAPGTFYFSGGSVTLNILLPTNTPNWPPSNWPLVASGSRAPLQTITVSFPSATLPLPTYGAPSINNNAPSLPAPPPREDRGNLAKRMESCTYNWGSNAEFVWGNNTTNGGAVAAQVGDVVRSVRAYPGDIRMVAGQLVVTGSSFDSGAQISTTGSLSSWSYTGTSHWVHSLRESTDYPFYGAIMGQLVPTITYDNQPLNSAPYVNGAPAAGGTTETPYGAGLYYFCGAGNSAGANGALTDKGLPGDWDNGFGYTADGPYINKADEGNLGRGSGSAVPYFGASNDSYAAAGQTFFSPNRLMPSPVMFGSLPTGVIRSKPWQTLLFCPNPAAGSGHPGFGIGQGTGAAALPPFTTPPDHLFLDLFTMPVVEPYPISEPLSTAGRVNINYQIVPFTYIERNTGIRAVLKSERMTVIPDSAAQSYKNGGGTAFTPSDNWDFRVPINADETLKGFDYYFANNNDIFRSASQVCSVFLYPAHDAPINSTTGPMWDSANANIGAFWNGSAGNGSFSNLSITSPTHFLTGINSRDRPYATIYPRVTTKSNTFTVHMRVQTLKKTSSDGLAANTWNESKDVVTGEYRGSQTIERYVDPGDTNLPDFATAFAASPTSAPTLNRFYKFRILGTTQFVP